MKPIVVMFLEMSLVLHQKRLAPSCAPVPGGILRFDWTMYETGPRHTVRQCPHH